MSEVKEPVIVDRVRYLCDECETEVYRCDIDDRYPPFWHRCPKCGRMYEFNWIYPLLDTTNPRMLDDAKQ